MKVEGKEEDNRNGAGNKQLEPEQFRKLFIGGLSLNTTDETLREFYSQFGELLDCVVMRDGTTKKSRGFGFVSFSTSEEVDRAMTARPHEIDGKAVDPKRAVPREQSSRAESNISTKRLYVSGVREDHTEDSFTQYFSSFGNVQKVEIITDKATDKPRGFAFVTFDDYDAVDKCVLQKSHMINNYRCDVKKALSKEDMNRAAQMDRDRESRGMRSRGAARQGPWGAGGGGRGGGYGGGRGDGYGAAWGPPGAWTAPPQGGGGWGPGYGYGYGGYGGGPGGGWGGAPPAQGGGQWQGGAPAAGGQGWGGSWAGDGSWGAPPQGAPAGGAPPAAGAWQAAPNAAAAGQWAQGGAPAGGQRF